MCFEGVMVRQNIRFLRMIRLEEIGQIAESRLRYPPLRQKPRLRLADQRFDKR